MLLCGSQPPTSQFHFGLSSYPILKASSEGDLYPAGGQCLLQFPTPALSTHHRRCSSASPADSEPDSSTPVITASDPLEQSGQYVSTTLPISRRSLVFPVWHTLWLRKLEQVGTSIHSIWRHYLESPQQPPWLVLERCPQLGHGLWATSQGIFCLPRAIVSPLILPSSHTHVKW